MKEFYKSIIDQSPVGYAYCKILRDKHGIPCDYKLIEMNASFEQFIGRLSSNMLGKKITEVLPDINESGFDWISFYRNVVMGGSKKEADQYLEIYNKWYKVSAYSIEKEYLVTNLIDISKEKKQLDDLNDFFDVRDITEQVKVEEIVKKGESKQGKMVANIGDVIAIIDQNGNNRYKSSNIEKLFGWKGEDLVGLKTWTNIHPDDVEKAQEFFNALIEVPGATGTGEYRYRCKDGKYKWIEITVVNLLNDPDICGLLGNYHDITDRKTMEKMLRQSEEKYRQITENISDVVWTTDLDLKTTYVSPSVETLIGDPVHVHLSRTMDEKFPVHSLNKIKFILNEELEKEKNPLSDKNRTRFIELEHYRADGETIFVNMHISFVRDENGNAVGLQGITRDITKQKEMEEDLMQEKLFIQKILDSLPGIFYLYTYPQLRLVRYNKNHEILLGYKPGEIMNRHIMEWHVPEAKPMIKKVVDDIMLLGQNVLESPLLSKDGRYIPFLITGISFDTPKQRYLMGIGVDLTERKEMEEHIFNEKEQFKTTLLSVGDGVISTNNQGRVLILNKVAETLTGWTQSEAFGKPLEEVFNIINEFTRQRCENPVYKVLTTGDIIELTNHTILVSKDNTEIPIEDSAAPIKDEKGNINGVVLVFRDFTEKKQKQDEIEYLSFHDQLTGLYNRRFYEEELDRLNSKCNLPLTLVMGDVNGLKLINDSFGHAVGDELLKKVANIMTKGCRADDIIARLGGDEFIIILPKTAVLEAENIIRRINELLSKETVRSINISISFGYKTKYHLQENIQEIFKRVEDDMYRHKLYESSSIRSKTIDVIIKTLYEKSNREMLHSKRVSLICEAIATQMKFDKDNINQIRIAGLMHDIGKIGIDEKILNKPQGLNCEEWKEITRHPEIGYRILSSANEFCEIAVYVLQHHEKWNGKGYPKGIKGKEISLQARIIAIADAFDAMTSDRTYRCALSAKMALVELEKNAGIQFDPELVRLFIEKVIGKI